MRTELLWWFIGAGWLLNLTPGPDVLYIVNQSLRGGARAGAVAGLGITAGCCVHSLAATVGVGALLATSAAAFGVLKWAGALYLLYVGVRLLLARGPGAAVTAQAPAPASAAPAATAAATVTATATAQVPVAYGAVFRGGFWTNALNPKVALFFVAFLPQFIAPNTAHPSWAFLALGLLFTVNALPVNLGWALAAAWLARHARGVQRSLRALDRAAGALFIAFGLRLAFTDNPAS